MEELVDLEVEQHLTHFQELELLDRALVVEMQPLDHQQIILDQVVVVLAVWVAMLLEIQLLVMVVQEFRLLLLVLQYQEQVVVVAQLWPQEELQEQPQQEVVLEDQTKT
jgi:hypothetical protein